jgi:hypothetical protein
MNIKRSLFYLNFKFYAPSSSAQWQTDSVASNMAQDGTEMQQNITLT